MEAAIACMSSSNDHLNHIFLVDSKTQFLFLTFTFHALCLSVHGMVKALQSHSFCFFAFCSSSGPAEENKLHLSCLSLHNTLHVLVTALSIVSSWDDLCLFGWFCSMGNDFLQ